MTARFCTHLMFDGSARQAMEFYVSLFPGSEIIMSIPYEEGDLAGKLQQGRFTLGGHDFICIDSPVPQDFTFTPSMSIFVEFDSRTELERVFKKLAEDGKELMPLDNYGFSELFGWVADRFGVSWQLNLTE